MDGHAHPPDFAEHASMGFSTGEWVGNNLKITTTHPKEAGCGLDLELELPKAKGP